MTASTPKCAYRFCQVVKLGTCVLAERFRHRSRSGIVHKTCCYEQKVGQHYDRQARRLLKQHCFLILSDGGDLEASVLIGTEIRKNLGDTFKPGIVLLIARFQPKFWGCRSSLALPDVSRFPKEIKIGIGRTIYIKGTAKVTEGGRMNEHPCSPIKMRRRASSNAIV